MRRLLIVLSAAAFLASCGRETHREAVVLSQTIEHTQPAYRSAGGMERDLISSTRGWVETIQGNGAGHGAEIAQNAAVAGELAHSADVISTQLGEIRKSLYDQTLQKDDLQAIRTTINAQITQRQKLLQQLRLVLTDTAAQFRALAESRTYKGDSYPAGIDRLGQILQAYHSPEDALRQALGRLKEDFGITSSYGGV